MVMRLFKLKEIMMHIRMFAAVIIVSLVYAPFVHAETPKPTGLYVMPNHHPACMGWVVTYAEERNFCLYNVLAHLDRIAEDPAYKFAFSEIPHLITMMEFEPERFREFQQRIKEGRIEVVNAFFLEPTLNLSGGEALVMQGVEGLRWYDQMLNIHPRYLWMIDTVGWHEQMAQIVRGLELDGFLYVRNNPTTFSYDGPKTSFYNGGLSDGKRGQALHWMQSPDGSRTLGINPGHYKDKDLLNAFMTTEPLTDNQMKQCIQQQMHSRTRYPQGFPILSLGSAHDYGMPFYYKGYPSRLISDWDRLAPSEFPIQMSTLSDYMNVVSPLVNSRKVELQTAKAGSSGFSMAAFWVQVPEIKQMYRRSEHALQASESLAAISNVKAKAPYPSQEFSNAWISMCLNMDRNILWGVLVDGSFADPASWDTMDRFKYVDEVAATANEFSMKELTSYKAESVALYNPVNWDRGDSFEVTLPYGLHPLDAEWQWLEDENTVLMQTDVPSIGLKSIKLAPNPPHVSFTTLPEVIENDYYRAVISPDTGNLASLKIKPSGREMFSAPANMIVAQQRDPQPQKISERFGIAHNVPSYSYRKTMASSGVSRPAIYVQDGPLAVIVDVREPFYGSGELRRVMRFYKNSPRIDFKTTTNGFPMGTVVAAEFPLAERVHKMRRGIPYGFSQGSMERKDPLSEGATKGIIPVIRWCDYELENGGGLALLDRGSPAREFADQKAIILLNHAAGDKYYYRDSYVMTDGRHQTYSYAVIAHDQDWNRIDIPRKAWEYNSPVISYHGGSVSTPTSFVQTSNNVIVEALRRVQDEIEIRIVECTGQAGQARIRINLDHAKAEMTNLLGNDRVLLKNGPEYIFEIRPQQIVTLRLKTADPVKPVEALKSFETLIPPVKRDYMKAFKKLEYTGHPGEYGREWSPGKVSYWPGGLDRKEFEDSLK